MKESSLAESPVRTIRQLDFGPPVTKLGATNVVARLFGDRVNIISEEFAQRVRNFPSDRLTGADIVGLAASMELTLEEYTALVMSIALTLEELRNPV